MIVGLIYTSYQIYASVFPSIKTETACITEMFDSIETDGYIIRDEREILGDSKNVLDFIVSDGDKVAKDEVIARLYLNEEEALKAKKYKSIEKEISKLKNINVESELISNNYNTIERQISQNMRDFIKFIYKGEYNKFSKIQNKILYSISLRQTLIGKPYDFSARIEKLKKQQDSFGNISSLKDIKSEYSGYFIGNIDGYEKCFAYNNVENISSEDIDMLFKNNSSPNAGAIAKIVCNSKWYVVFNVSSREALKFKSSQFVRLSMPLVNQEKINASVVSINESNNSERAAIVLLCDDVSKNILFARKGPIRVDFSSYRGISVDKSAIHERTVAKVIKNDDGETTIEIPVKGVYIRCGRQIVFKEIDIIYYGDEYVLCNIHPDDNLFTDGTLQEYDEVIVKGKGLYDGKVVR